MNRLRRRRPRRVAQLPRIEHLEARIVLGYFSGDNLDEVPLPIFPTACPTCVGTVAPEAGTASPVMESTRPVSSQTERPVRHFDGLPVVFTSDLHASVSPLLNFGQTRSWSGLNNSGPVGNGWSINELPYIVVAGGTNGASSPGGWPGSGVAPGTAGDDRLTVVAGGTTAYTFSVDAQSPYGSYPAWGLDSIQLVWAPDPSPALRLTDPEGNVTEFYDVRRGAGGRPVFHSMAEDLPQKYGRFKGYTSADGSTQIEANYDANGVLNSVVVTDATAGDVGRLSYIYDTVTNDLVTAASATPPELLASVTLERPDGSGGWDPVQRASYTYYTGRLPDGSGGWENDPHGRLGDLQFVRVETVSGSGGPLVWNEVDASYYRYSKFTGESNQRTSKGPTNNAATTGGPSPIQPSGGTYNPNHPGLYDQFVFSGLKTVVEGAALARLAAAVPNFVSASDAALEPYVNHFFRYERWADHVGVDGSSWYGSESWNGNSNYHWRTGYRMGTRYRAIEEIAQGAGCSTCSGGQGTYKYEYATHNGGLGEVIGYNTLEYNTWAMKTTEYLPGNSLLWGGRDRRVTYTNEVGQPLLSVFVGVTGPSFIVQGVTNSGSGSTIFTVPGHPFESGDRVAVTGVLPQLYNGVYTVTRLDADRFSFQLPASYYSSGAPFAHINHSVGDEMLVTTVTAVASEEATYYRYNDQGRLILQAEPSAVIGYDDAYPELVRAPSGDFVYLHDDEGLIRTYEYYATGGDNLVAYLGDDDATQGDWRAGYGGEGFHIAQDPSAGNPDLPAYAQVNITGAYGWTWASSTSDLRALENAAGTGRIAATWASYSHFDIALDLTDGRAHRVTLYALDWDNFGGGRVQRFDLIDPVTEAVLDSRTISDFQDGVYLSWTVQGQVTIRVVNLNSNAVVSGLFFGPATVLAGSGAAGRLRASYEQRGLTGTPIVQQMLTYEAHAAGDATVYRVATDTVFGRDHGIAPDFSDRDPRTTTYSYTLFPGTVRVESVTVAAPVVSAAQNGSGTIDLTTTVFDVHGRPIWLRDGEGALHHLAYDPSTGAVTKQIADVDTTQTGDFADLPSGWSTPTGGGLHLITTTEVDGLGRTVRQVDPAGTVTWVVYNDAAHEVRVYRGWDAVTGTATGPIEVRREYRPAPGAPVGERTVYFEALTLDAAPTVDPVTGTPTGQETITAGAIGSLRRDLTNAGGQVIESLAYFSMAGLSYATATAHLGTASNDSGTGHYHATAFGYDHRGRPGRVLVPSGTITRTVYDTQGRVVGVWIGTDDTGATDTNPAGTGAPNNMIQVAAYEYDGGEVGDGNLTRVTEFPRGGADPRVTALVYDWRNRLVATKEGAETSEDPDTNRPLTFATLDNLGMVTALAVYDGDGVSVGTTPPAAGLLRAFSAWHYDAQGRPYRAEQFGVDPSTGAVSTHALTTDVWYDRRGQVIKVAEPGGLVTKTSYDGIGRPIIVFQTDGGGDSSWADARHVVGDIVLTQVETTYDANGNPILRTTRDRFHDNAPSATGVLGTPTTGNRARVSYVASYYDAADRLSAVVNVGTHGGTAYTRPTSVPSRSDTTLVTSYTYGGDGRVETITDPRGQVTHFEHDLMGRSTRVIEAYTDGVPTATTNKRVEYTYDGMDNVLTLGVALPGGGWQTTGYVYGVSPAFGSAIASNDLLAEVRRPDKTTGLPSATESETFTFNALGEQLTATDRNGTTRTFTHDVLGRLVADTATTLGTGVDGAVRRRETAYDVDGRPTLLTSFDAVSGGTIVNQVRRDYNGLGQLVTEYQAHAGAVNTGTTPRVQYGYSAMAGGANHSRLVGLTYPDGRVLHYGYASGLDDAIGRVTYLADDDGLGDPGQILEQYDYLGLGTIVVRSRPETGIDLSYVKRPGEPDGDAGDPYTGLDRFGRVVDQRWLEAATGTAVDRYGYGHDRGGNRLYRANLLDAAFDELYAYDETNQLASFTRGVLSDANSDGVPDTIANPSRTRSWDFDALGNWDEVTTDGTPEGRTHNAQNQLTGVGSTTLTYDANGNLTTDEAGRTFVHDAWNRPVAVADSGSNPLAYTYDALNRRIAADDGTARQFHHSADWQVLEERVTGGDDVQYVWSLAYVDALVLRDQDTERLYALQDANWNVTALVDVSGDVVERYAYDPYGAVMVLAKDGTARVTSDYDWVYLHQGGRYDAASGLYHFRNRDYSPTLGRWTREDPIGFAADDANTYRYIRNNVPTFVDPSGLYGEPNYVSSGWIFSYYDDGSVWWRGGNWNPANIFAGPGNALGLLISNLDKDYEKATTIACQNAAAGSDFNATTGSMANFPGGVYSQGTAQGLEVGVELFSPATGVVGPGGFGSPWRIGPRWRPKSIFDPAARHGCEAVAKQIHKHIGGDIVVITAPGRMTLGPYRGKDWGWFEHSVVIKGGKVYDAFTGVSGEPIDVYKGNWPNPHIMWPF